MSVAVDSDAEDDAVSEIAEAAGVSPATVVVAVYGQPDRPSAMPPRGAVTGPPSPVAAQENVPIDPSPDYDASDEIEYGINWLPWILRGVYPPPAMPPQ